MSLARWMAVVPFAVLHALASASTVDAQAPRLAASCANCHGTNGMSAGGAIPGLAGQRKETIIAKMQAFKSGAAPATVMHQLARGYTDEQIERIAAFFAQQALAK